MEKLSMLLLASHHADLQIDIKCVAPDYAIATSKEQVLKAIEDKNNCDRQAIEPLHYLGVARCQGFHQLRFVIRALSYVRAYAIFQNCLGRINTSPKMQKKLQQSSALFMGGLVSDEEANKYELRKFIEFASTSLDPLFVLDGRDFGVA